MEILLKDDLRLVYALSLQAAIVVAAWRFIRRRVPTDWADRAADVLLLSFLVQYLSVALPGLLGILNPLTIAASTLALSAALYFAPIKGATLTSPSPEPAIDRWALLTCTLLAIGFMIAVNLNYLITPVLSNDAITYHFPAAVQWLRIGRLGLFETWFFNPANTYSPLAGSTFITWWMAPLGNDILARKVQFPALFLIFFASIRLLRAIGARTTVACVIALALLLSRPFFRQALFEKDDLYLAAFFTCAVAACSRARLSDAPAAWRIGIALGLMLATKYTALLALPALLLVIDAPWRARWSLKQYAIAIAIPLVLAGPWYLRNLFLTGNPLYPVQVSLFGHTLLPGLFTTARSQQFASPSSIWSLLTARDSSLPLVPMLLLLPAYLAALAKGFRHLRADPLLRICLFGSPAAFILFIATSPYPEVRFLYPAFVLLFVTTAIAITKSIRPLWAQLIAATVLLIACWATAWTGEAFRILGGEMVATAALITLAGLGVTWALASFPAHRRVLIRYGSLAAALLFAASVYVDWESHIQSCRVNALLAYAPEYGATAEAWKFVREELPPKEPLAYTNTFLIHPMSGFDHDRPLLYIPTRRNLRHLHDLPALQTRLSGEQIVPAMAAALTSDTDADGWLANLAQSGATHLIVFKHGVVPNPPELSIIAAHSNRFDRVFENEAAIVYRLRK